MQGFFDFFETVWLVIWGVLTGDDSIASWFACLLYTSRCV